MLVIEYVTREMPEADQLQAMFASSAVGASMCRLQAAPFDSRTFRKLVGTYAGCAEGPFGRARLELHHQVHDLFENLRRLPGNEGMKGYELKDSFLGGEEADLVMILASHQGISQEALAHDVLLCSKNAVGERRARMKDGIRIGGMCVQAEFGYRGEFQSSVHPVSLPLNLSEVYVLMDALAGYAGQRDERDPHRQAAERLAGMVKGQLSDYAAERLQPRLEEMGFGCLESVDPVFRFDSPRKGEGLGAEEQADPMYWLYYQKSGTLACVELADGREVKGVVLPDVQAWRLLEEQGVVRKDRRPCCVVFRSEDDYDIIPWADVVDVRKGRQAIVD